MIMEEVMMTYVSLSILLLFWCSVSIYEASDKQEATIWLIKSVTIFVSLYVLLHIIVYGIDTYEYRKNDCFIIGSVGAICLGIYIVTLLVINFRNQELYKEASVFLLKFYYLEEVIREFFGLPIQEIEKINVTRDGILRISKVIMTIYDDIDESLLKNIKTAYEYFPRVDFSVKQYKKQKKKVKIIAQFSLSRKITLCEKVLLKLAMNLFLSDNQLQKIWDSIDPNQVCKWGN